MRGYCRLISAPAGLSASSEVPAFRAFRSKKRYQVRANPLLQKPSQFPLFRAHFSKKMLSSIVMAAADRCAGDKDRATCCRPPARTRVQACRSARASSSKIPVVERRGWRPVHKRKAEDAWSCARRRRRRSCSSRSAIRRPDAGSCHRGRELFARPKTAGDPAATAPSCCVPCAPCAACTCFFLRARQNPTGAEKRAAQHAVHCALREHLRSRTKRRCSPAPSLTHAEAQANNAHFAHSHARIHTHVHTRTHTHTYAHLLLATRRRTKSTHIHIHTHIHTRIHTRAHTHLFLAVARPINRRHVTKNHFYF